MSATVKELKDWLADLHDDQRVGIDDGGLTLKAYEDDPDAVEAGDDPTVSWFEIGGIPEETEGRMN